MKALILAAGRGDRLGAYTRDRPKAMVRVAGRALIDHVLEFLDHDEIEEIGIIGGYKYEVLRAHIENIQKTFKKKIRLFYNPDFHEGSVRTIMTALDFIDTDFILLNADHIYPKKMFIPYLRQMDGITVATDNDRKLAQDDMKVKKDGNGFLKKIQKTLKDFDCGYIGSTYVPKDKIGAYRGAVVETYEIYGKNSNAEAVIGHLAANGHRIKIADLSGIGWYEVDTPEDRLRAEQSIWRLRTLGKKYLRYILGAFGAAMFAVLVHKLGPGNIWKQLLKVGWWIIPILSLSALWHLGNTLAWYQFLGPLGRKLKLRELFKIKIIGEAISAATPLNFVAGDPSRAYLLKQKFPMTEVAASVVVDRTLQTISTITIVLLGVTAAVVKLEFLPYNIKYGLPAVVAVASVFIGFIFAHQHKGLFIFLTELAKKLRIKKSFSTETLKNLSEVDGHIQEFYKKNRKGFVLALFLNIGGKILGILEIFFTGYAVDHNFSLETALLLGATAPVINLTFAFIPGSLGIMESAYSAILYFLHFPPSVGITIQIIRRIRSGSWMMLGMVLLGVHGRKKLLQN